MRVQNHQCLRGRPQQMERIQRLPKAQQRFVMRMVDTVLAHQGR
jgi:hypothetical protein